jgi:hypothetical protein
VSNRFPGRGSTRPVAIVKVSKTRFISGLLVAFARAFRFTRDTLVSVAVATASEITSSSIDSTAAVRNTPDPTDTRLEDRFSILVVFELDRANPARLDKRV